jgi:hypothetical protein
MANLKKISTFAASKSTSFHIFPVKSIKNKCTSLCEVGVRSVNKVSYITYHLYVQHHSIK